MEKSNSANVGEIFNNTWELKKCIGKGSFSEIFLAKDITQLSDAYVAIKVQNTDFDSTVIRWESEVLKALITVPTVPKFIHYGTQEKANYLVMDILSGEDMASLRNRIRARTPSGLVALPGAVYLTRQMLKCIRDIHNKGYVHRDVKPANFVRTTCNSTQFSTIDFGIAKLYREKNGTLRPKRDKAEFRGTTLYASVHTHELQDQAPRDDLYSIVFVLLDLICGKLPWTEATRNRDKPQVAALKRQYFDSSEELVKWVSSTVTAAEQNHNFPEHYQGNFPVDAQRECLLILSHLKSLTYEDIPDYDLIDLCLQRCFTSKQEPDVSQESYSYMGFHWAGGLDKLQRGPRTDRLSFPPERPSLGGTTSLAGTTTNANSGSSGSISGGSSGIGSGMRTSASFATVEYYTGGSGSTSGAGRSIEAMRLHQVCTKINSMLKEYDMRMATTGCSSTSSSSNSISDYATATPASLNDTGESASAIPPTDISVAIRWKNLVKDLMLLPEHVITGEVLRLFYRALVVHDGFLNITLPIEDTIGNSSSSSSGGGGSRMENLVKAVLPQSNSNNSNSNSGSKVAWNNFVEVHQVVGQFYELYDRIAPAVESEEKQETKSLELASRINTTSEQAAIDDDVEGLLAGLRDGGTAGGSGEGSGVAECMNVEDVDHVTCFSGHNEQEQQQLQRDDLSLLEKRASVDGDRDAEMEELLQDVKRVKESTDE